MSDVFGMPSLEKSVIDKRWQFKLNLHYKYFVITKAENLETHKNKKELYLTYFGLIRVLMVSRNKQVEQFQSWAINEIVDLRRSLKSQSVSYCG